MGSETIRNRQYGADYQTSRKEMTRVLKPFDLQGLFIFLCIKVALVTDPCCGSGGMFVQSAELVKAKRGDISRINIYGQEKDGATYRLAKMNLALRGISHNLGETYDSSFTHDLHKGLYFNYIMANEAVICGLTPEKARNIKEFAA